MKNSLDAYGPFPSSIRSNLRFSSMNFFAATSSSAGSRIAFAGKVAGASGLRSIAWSYGLCGGNRSEAFSLNTFANCWYSVGSKTSVLVLLACSASFEAIVCRESAARTARALSS
jgi:hypothetical protein